MVNTQVPFLLEIMPKKNKLIFEAIKYKYQDDEDGEAILLLRINMQDKLSAFAVPAKKRLKIIVEIIDD